MVAVRAARGDQVVHAGQEAVRGADVGVRLDVEGGGELEAPVPFPVAYAGGKRANQDVLALRDSVWWRVVRVMPESGGQGVMGEE